MKIAKTIPMTTFVRSAYLTEIKWANPAQAEREFDSWIEAVERAASEKAWDEGANTVIDCFWDGENRRPVNPYRLEEGTP